MDKDGVIRINNFQVGQAPSMHLGINRIANLDITSDLGIARVQFATNLVRSTTNLPKYFVNAWNASKFYSLMADGNLYEGATPTSWSRVFNPATAAQGNGLGYWQGYVFIARNTFIDIYNPLTGNTISAWGTLDNSTQYHPMIVTKDDVLYIADGTKVYKIKRVGATFDPMNPATYVQTPGFLDLKQIGITITAMSEVGTSLACGVSAINPGSAKIADIYYWNSNTSTDLFTSKLSIREAGVSAMLNVGNYIYVVAGAQSTVYVCNTLDFAVKKKLSFFDFSNSILNGARVTGGGMAKMNDEILFGVGTLGQYPTPMGVYALNPALEVNANGGAIYCRNTISTGQVGDAPYVITIGGILSVDSNTLLIGWSQSDGITTTYGIDCVGQSDSQIGQRYTNYQAFFESQLYRVGTFHNKKTFQQLEFSLVRPLRTGESLRFKYRINKTDAWTIVTQDYTAPTGDFSFDALGAIISHNFPFGNVEAEYIEIRGELSAASGTETSPELREVILS